MRKWFVLIWLLVPVALLTYHYGPGQSAAELGRSREFYRRGLELESLGQFEDAIAEYGEAMANLPITSASDDDLRLANDQLRLSQLRVRFRQGKLAESLIGFRQLSEDVSDTHGIESPIAMEVRELLGRAHYEAMVALRLESADEEIWMQHWELARQHYRVLAERSPQVAIHGIARILRSSLNHLANPSRPLIPRQVPQSIHRGWNRYLSQ